MGFWLTHTWKELTSMIKALEAHYLLATPSAPAPQVGSGVAWLQMSLPFQDFDPRGRLLPDMELGDT